MAQFCIFCGKKPENKNKEHVIPQWLSKETNRYKRVCHLDGVTDKQIPFSQLTFPACTECNSKFAQLESQAQSILADIRAGKSLDAMQIHTFLDWMDKIRVGLWLGELTLSNQIEQANPKFHIADRVGLKDRVLMIERIADFGKGLAFVGVATDLFLDSPSVFQLIIDNYVFTSASEHGLVSGKLGFPNVSKIHKSDDRVKNYSDVTPGRNRAVHPVVMNMMASPMRTIIYQPIFRAFNADQRQMWDNPYVRAHSLSFEHGVGGIFYQKNNNTVQYLDGESRVNISPKQDTPYCDVEKVYLRTLSLQNYVLENRIDFKSVSDASRRCYNVLMAKNNMILRANNCR